MAKSGTSWKKGESGNPKGRPRNELSIAQVLREIGFEQVSGMLAGTGVDRIGTTGSRVEHMARKLWDLAIAGNIGAARLIFERTEGLPDRNMKAVIHTTSGSDLANLTDEDRAEYERAVAQFFTIPAVDLDDDDEEEGGEE